MKKRLNSENARRSAELQLKESTERNLLRNAYRAASLVTRGTLVRELRELEELTAEGLPEARTTRGMPR